MAAALMVLTAVYATAQNQHKNQERGFSANGVYSGGDLDHINLFNGNLTVSIPIGQPYPVNGQLSYAFTLVYNSNPWSPREVCSIGIDQDIFFSSFLSVDSRYVNIGGQSVLVSQHINQTPGGDPYDASGIQSSSDGCYTIQDPNPATNAGLGWQLSFGKLYKPRDDAFDDRPNYTEKSNWVYMSPDGSEHTFYRTLHVDDVVGSSNIWYTRDDTYLRLNMSPPANGYQGDMMIEFPNGQKHYFQNLLVRNADNQHQIREIKEEKLRGIEDQYGNYVRIDYVDKNGDGIADDEWQVSDSAGRHHVVTFGSLVVGYQKVIQDIKLESFNGTSVHYGLTYESTVDINRPEPHITPNLIPESTNTLKVPLLTSVKLPASIGSQYSMPVNPNDLASAAYDVPGDETLNPGLLRKLVLPTGGIIEWKYKAENPDADRNAGYGYKYGFGAVARHYLRSSIGVRRRTMTINKGTGTEKVYTWKYDPKVGDNYPTGCQQQTQFAVCAPVEFVNKVTTPDCDDANINCDYTLNYFSIYPYPYGGQGVGLDTLKRGKADPHAADYALPFTKDSRAQSDPARPPRTIANDAWNGYPLFLSQAIYDKSGTLKRSVYVRYETDVLTLNDGYGQTLDSNARVAATRTVYHDDGGTYAETQYLDFDGLGHYRQENLLGNFGSGDRRLNIVWYNRTNGSYSVDTTTNQRTTTYTPVFETSPWLLETFDSKISSDFVNYRSTSYFSFNNKGLVQAKRTLRNFETPSTAYNLTPKDVLVTYAYDAGGNLINESYYGGDKKANASTSSTFSATGASEYAITNSYTCGTGGARTTGVVSLSYYTANPSLKVTDATVDCSTGIVTSSRDSAGVQTTYQYDDVGRLTRVARQQGAIDKITYSDVQSGAINDSPQITVEHLAQDASFTPLGDEIYKYDQLGRLFEQRERMPGVGSAAAVYKVKTVAFNGMGWKTAESEWNDGTTSAGRQTKYDDFDPFGRPGTIYLPDYTTTNKHLVKLFYSGVRTVNRTVRMGTQVVPSPSLTVGEDDAVTVETYDRQGRLWQVRESSGVNGANVTTTYAYNVNNELVSAVTPAQLVGGAQLTQTRTFAYDNLGNLRSENLPEVSNRFYDNYDTMGHVGTEYTGKSNLRYTYDFAGRLITLEEQNGAQYRPLKDYVFYASNSPGNYSLGKVQTARRYNWMANPYQTSDPTELGVVVKEDYTYGGIDGRLSKTTTRLNAETDIVNHTPKPDAYTFDQTFTYDPRGNLLSQTYPQCANATCASSAGAPARPWRTNYTYKNNWVINLGGGAGTTNTDDVHYAAAIRYQYNGLINNIFHGNGVRDQFDADPNFMSRQANITVKNGAGTQLWTSGNYAYDGAGDITKIGSDWYAYDKVGRVVEGTSLDAGGKKRRYTYDAFGNVTGYQTYNGVTASGGSPALLENFTTNAQPATNRVSLNYDGAGNAMGLVGQSPLYTYDALNMVKYAPGFTYLYTPDDERVWSIDNSSLGSPDLTWIEDSLPAGAQPTAYQDTWSWDSINPSPFAGSLQHQSVSIPANATDKVHQHYFTGATATMKVGAGDSLFAYVYLDPANMPSEVMLQWDDGTGAWAHRAFWGADQIPWGTPGATSTTRHYMGPLPPAGSWQRLEVPAAAVGLEGVTVNGMAFSLYGGHATWDHAGRKSNAVVETVTLRGLGNEALREYQVRGGDATNHWTWLKDNIYAGSRLIASETPQGTRHYHLDHLGTPKLITDAAGNPLPGAPYTNFPFGEDTSYYPPADSHTPPSDEKLRFTGQERNFDYSMLGIYYMHARYYFPNNAKFLSVDPSSDVDPQHPQSWNLYSYVRNNPVNATDPSGRSQVQGNTTPVPLSVWNDIIRRTEAAQMLTPEVLARIREVWRLSGLGFLREAGFRVDETGKLNGDPTYNVTGVSTSNDQHSHKLSSGPSTTDIFHSHPNNSSEEPSTPENHSGTSGTAVTMKGGAKVIAGGDTNVADKTGARVWVIHRKALTVYDPQTKQIYRMLEGPAWQEVLNNP
jgi:RHS repeat-associated protein